MKESWVTFLFAWFLFLGTGFCGATPEINNRTARQAVIHMHCQ